MLLYLTLMMVYNTLLSLAFIVNRHKSFISQYFKMLYLKIYIFNS